MEYPKKVMRMTELVKMGFPEETLRKATMEKGQTFAWKNNPKARNSPLMFDTTEFEKWRQRQAKTTTQALRGLAGRCGIGR